MNNVHIPPRPASAPLKTSSPEPTKSLVAQQKWIEESVWYPDFTSSTGTEGPVPDGTDDEQTVTATADVAAATTTEWAAWITIFNELPPLR